MNTSTIANSSFCFNQFHQTIDDLASFYQLESSQNLNFLRFQGFVESVFLIIIVDSLRQEILFSDSTGSNQIRYRF